MEKEITAYSK